VKKEDKREGKDGGRRRYRGYVKIGIALLVVPIILLCLAIRNSKKLYRKVSRVLELENNVFAQRYGYEWSINKCMTELTLRRSDSSRRVENSGTQLQSMPYQGAPMFTEESQYGQRGFQERNYDRVNLDDSTAIYK
jgi:hypothetical protein